MTDMDIMQLCIDVLELTDEQFAELEKMHQECFGEPNSFLRTARQIRNARNCEQ